MEHNQFETLMLAITGLKGEMNASITSLKDEMNRRFNAVDKRFDRLEFEVQAISQQVAQTHVEVTGLKTRVARLESPSA